MYNSHFSQEPTNQQGNPCSLLLALLCLLVTFVSCDKSEDEAIPKIPKIKTITHYTGSKINSESYEYNPAGRLIKISYSDGTYDQYDYHTDIIIRKSFLFTGADTLILNNEGRVVSDMFGVANYEYHPNGKLAKAIFQYPEGIPDMSFEYKVSDENTTSLYIWETVNGNLTVAKTYQYEYLANSTNTIGYENMGITFYGKQDKNLLSVKTLTNHQYNSQEVVTYHYKLDIKNRVVKKWTEGSQDSDYYTYAYYN